MKSRARQFLGDRRPSQACQCLEKWPSFLSGLGAWDCPFEAEHEAAASGRHRRRIASVELVSDTAVLRNDTLIRAAGRTIRVAQALDEIVALILERAPTAGRVAA